MSKTLVILLGLALIWLTAWAIAGYYMRQAGIEKLVRSDHLSTPATRLERGADVRVEGVIVERPSVASPFSGKQCLAAVTRISVVSRYRDSKNKPATESSNIETRRVGRQTSKSPWATNASSCRSSYGSRSSIHTRTCQRFRRTSA